jgi:hypothetical protein
MPAFFVGVNMSEKSVRPPVRPQSSRQEIVDYINQAFETSDIGEICQAMVRSPIYTTSQTLQKNLELQE